MPKKPEDWLEIASPPQKARGIFKLFLGYAPGVGKTYSMLSEALRRHSRGEDVVIGVVETHGRKAIEELFCQLEIVPRRKIEYKGTIFEEMDVDAILARRPDVVLVDELAHTNIPGSKHRKRYEDVQELIAAKIDVISTLNIQHIESIAPVVRSITGIIVRETVPDWVPLTASETVMVDLTPEALQNRMKRGDVYSAEKVERSLKNFFRRGNLIALRELALRQVAEQVDLHLIQSDRTVSHRPSGAYGPPHGRGALRSPRGSRVCSEEIQSKCTSGEPAICRKPWWASRAVKGKKRSGCGGGFRALETHHASDFRTRAGSRLAEILVSLCRAPIFARVARRRCAHRNAGNGRLKQVVATAWPKTRLAEKWN